MLGHPDLLAAAANRRVVKLRDGREGVMVYCPLPPARRHPGATRGEAAQAVVEIGGRRERVDPADIIALVAPYESQCQGKRAYTKPDAKQARDRFQAVCGERMGVYRCPHCSMWHVGHSDERPKARPA